MPLRLLTAAAELVVGRLLGGEQDRLPAAFAGGPVVDGDGGLYWPDPDGTGPEAHSVSATSAPTAEVIVPPWLGEVSVQRGIACNFSPRGTVLQAGQRGPIVSFSTDFLGGSGRREEQHARDQGGPGPLLS